MSTENQHNRRSAHEYREHQELTDRRRHLQTAATTAVEQGHEAASKGDLEELASIIDDAIVPILGLESWDVPFYDARCAEIDQPFNAEDVRSAVVYGALDLVDQTPPDFIRSVFRSLESCLIADGYLQGTIETEQPVTGYQTQLGIRHLRATSRSGGTLSINEPGDEIGTILFAGGKGAGKSTGLGTLVEDRIAHGHKIIDVLDFHKAENATYDIESRDEDLREIREEMGLDVGFEEYDPPDLEIYAPLTKDLEAARVPFRVDEDGEIVEPVVRPFTIPASELSYEALCMVLPHITKTHMNYLGSAYQMLDSSGRDWTLEDMADAVRFRTNASATIADKIERSLRTTQNKSFIRDKKCKHRLDWRELMADNGTITAFTVHMCGQTLDKKMVLSYLVDKIADVRDDLLIEAVLADYPPVSCVFREFHKVAPNSLSPQEPVAELERYMISSARDIFAMARHQSIEVIADTQQFRQQLSRDVSGLFDEIYAFQGQKPDVRKIFNTRVGSEASDVAERVSQYDTGECAHVSKDGYKLPIEFAPPRFHHLDASRDGSGLGFRTREIEDEELRKVSEATSWSAEIPDRLHFDLEVEDTAVETFLKSKLEHTGDAGDHVFTSSVTAVYLEWCDEEGVEPLGATETETHNKLHAKLKEVYEIDGDEVDCQPVHPENGMQKPARRGFRFDYRSLSDRERRHIPERH